MAAALAVLAGWGWWTFFGPAGAAPVKDSDTISTAIENAANGAETAATRPADTKPPALNADSKTKIQAAKNYVDLKNYAMAEDLYKQVLNTDPTNVEALPALASVLYREDKIEEAASVLDRIPK
jgi:thioredoxin-like negative regulator of GroEL